MVCIPIKRQRLSEWIKNQDPNISCVQKTHFKYKDTCSIKVNERGKIYHANTNQKKIEAAILISNRADFRARKVIRDKEEHHMQIKTTMRYHLTPVRMAIIKKVYK